MLTPLDIHNKEFKRSFRGYNEDEIDDFLDQVVNDYEKLFRDNDNLKEEVARLKKENQQFQKNEDSIKETLKLAQQTATNLTESAKQDAQSLRENTAKECQNMRRDAEISARQMTEAADHQVKAATVEYCRLIEAKSQFLLQTKAALESELAVLRDAIDRLPRQQAAAPKQEAPQNLQSQQAGSINGSVSSVQNENAQNAQNAQNAAQAAPSAAQKG
ncbi:MAG: DivIVA domain-containing protein [Mitsuokella sp.]|uniref:DivIVA domain-containing protein n=1 Tax=Mitsuokella sp. TaxID=2049034 RepID=UPI003F12300A